MLTSSKKMNSTVDLQLLTEYYATIARDYNHLKWSAETHADDIIEKWKDKNMTEKTHGWGIQSNIEDLSIACPPFNITSHPRVAFRNTELVFGIGKTLVDMFPFAFRWAISVQTLGGKVALHSDNDENLTVWIPITSPPKSFIVFVKDGVEEKFNFKADGSMYLLDTSIPHYTTNEDVEPRVILSFRANVRYESLLMTL